MTQSYPTDNGDSGVEVSLDKLAEIGHMSHLATIVAIIRQQRDETDPGASEIRNEAERIRGERLERRNIHHSLERLRDKGVVERRETAEGATETYQYRLSDDGVVFATGLGLDRLAGEIEGRDPTPDWITRE